MEQPTHSGPTPTTPVAPQPVSPTPGKKKSNTTLWIILASIVGLLLIGGVVAALVLLRAPANKTKTTTNTTTTTTTTNKTTPTVAANSTCLVNSDYKYWSYDKSMPSVTYDTTYDPAKYTFNATSDMFFDAGTTNEQSLLSVYDDVADFASHNASKQWKIRLEGSFYGNDASQSHLADDRAAIVKAQLIKRGVPESRIVIDAPHDYTNEAQDSTITDIYQRVQMVVDPTCV